MSPLLKQRYLIIDELGRGGMGVVFKARDIQLGDRLVAVKEMGQNNPSQEAINAFKREAEMLARLMHPHLPSIHEHFTESGNWYLVMEFIEGETLEDYVEARGGWLPLKEVLDIGIQLCTVLDYLHTRQPPIIFRDLKPLNVMRSPDGHLYLIDFGIARHFKPGQAKDTIAYGSAGYAAPEQFGRAQTTIQSDIYSLGATLHRLLTGNDPSSNVPTLFDFPPLQWHGQLAPADFESLIMQMVEKAANKRPTSMAVVKQELQTIVAQPAGKKPLPPTQPARLSPFPPTQPAHALPQKPVNSPQPVVPKRIQPPQLRPARGAKQVVLPASPASVKRGISRRAVVISLASAGIAVVGGGITWWALAPHPFQGLRGPVNSVSWSPDGAKIASGLDDHTVQIWDAVKGTKLLTYQGHSGPVRTVAWSLDGAKIASGSDDSTVQIWDANSGKTQLAYQGHSSVVFSVAWSPDETKIASASNDHTVQIWDAASGTKSLTYRGHSSTVNTVAWSSSRKYLASGSDDYTMQVWDAISGEKLFSQSYSDSVFSVAWSPDGTQVALGAHSSDVQVWNPATGAKLLAYRGNDSVWSVAWSPDGKKLASASDNVQVWDPVSGKQLITYQSYTNAVLSVAWSPDGTKIVLGAYDQAIQVLNAPGQ